MRPNKQKAEDNMTLATFGMSSVAVAALSLAEVYAIVKVEGLSVTFARNMQERAVRRVKHFELREIADDIVTRMKGSFPDIAATPKRDRTIKVWLDGLPKEAD